MHNFNELEITEVMPTSNGIFIFAKFQNWFSGYNFCIESGGKTMGQTTAGLWAELSQESSSCLKCKLQCFLIDKAGFLHA